MRIIQQQHRLGEGQSLYSILYRAFSYSSHSRCPSQGLRWQRVVAVEKLAYAWVELCYARQSEQFDTPWVEGEYDDEWGMVDKLAVSTQSCIHDQEYSSWLWNYHASWQSWQGRGPAHARIRWCGKGWRRVQDANNQGTSLASHHRWTPKEQLWRGSLGPDPVAKPI